MLGSLIDRGVKELTKRVVESSVGNGREREDRTPTSKNNKVDPVKQTTPNWAGNTNVSSNPWEMSIFGAPSHTRGGQAVSQADADKRYAQTYGDDAMADVLAKRARAAAQGYGSVGEMNYYEKDPRMPSQGPNYGGFPQTPFPGFPQMPGFPNYGYPQYPQPYPQQPTNGGINPGNMYGGGQMWAGGTPYFDEKTGQYTQPQQPGGGQMWAGGTPYFNERTGQYAGQQPDYSSQIQQQLQLIQQQMQSNQGGMNWDTIFSAMMPMLFGGGGMGGFGGFSPYGNMGNMYGGGYGSPYGGYF